MLPVIAVLHVRHLPARQSGAMLGTIAGTTVVAVGIAAAALPATLVPALLVRGIWWWTMGKLWWETGLLPRWFGAITLALAVVSFALVAATAPLALDVDAASIPIRGALALWLLTLSAILWRTR